MKIFSTLNHLHSIGAKDGKERGLLAGACRQLGKLLLRHGKRLFGPPLAEQRTLVEGLIEQWNLSSLEQARDRLVGMRDWSELLREITVGAGRPADPDYLLPFEFDPEPIATSIDEYAEMSKPSGEKLVVHIRIQRRYQDNIGSILYRDTLRVQAQHHCQVQTAVLLLWPGADGPTMTGEYEIPTGGTYQYQVTRLWEKDADEMFDSIATVAYAPLGKFAPERLPEIVRRMDESIEARCEEDKRNLWVVAYWSMGLRYPAEQVNELLRHRLPSLLARKEFRGAISEGYYEAFTHGESEGAFSAARRWVLALGKQRLGEPEPVVAQGIAGCDSLERLEQLAARVLKGASWQEVLAAN